MTENSTLPLLSVRRLDVFFGANHAVKDVDLDIADKEVHAIIGSSASGKSSLLRALSRNLDTVDVARVDGDVLLNGQDIYAVGVDSNVVRRRLCYVGQNPALFRGSIWRNVSLATRYWMPHLKNSELKDRVESSLTRVGLEQRILKAKQTNVETLSAGEKQKVALARALAISPGVLLLDEPTANLDVISCMAFEDVIGELRGTTAVVIITHSLQQAARVSQNCYFLHLGELVEADTTASVFTNPRDPRTERYITGRVG